MKKIYFVFVSVLSLALMLQAVFAAEPDNLSKNHLQALIGDLNNAADHKNINLIAANMPDKLFREMALRLSKPESELREHFLKQLQTQFNSLPKGGYRLDGEHIVYKQTHDNTFYALIPTRIETEKKIVTYMTLAIFDDANWHVIYGGQKTVQNPVFQEIYPAYQNVSIPLEKVILK